MNKKPYRPFHQLPYCCVPATLQWILYSRDLDILDQETIGVELGLRIPKRFKYLFSNKKIQFTDVDPPGTQIFEKGYSINNFFQNFNIPLGISEEFHFQDTLELEKFVIKNLKNNKDIILRFNNQIFKSGHEGVGHFALIIKIEKKSKRVIVGDPDPPFFKKATLEDIIFSISDKIDGQKRGLFLIEEK